MSDINSYKSIDFLLNILYDKIYNPDTNKCYIVPPIIKNEITIDTLKRQYSDNSDEIDKLFKDEGTYLGKYNGKWVFKLTSLTTYPCLMTISEYEHKNYDDLSKGENINMAFHYMTSELVIGDKIKYYLLPVMNFDIDQKIFEKKAKNIYKKLDVKSNESMLCVNINECYFDICTLKEYLDKTKMTPLKWKILLFQILFALFKLQEKFKKFRHNMLNLEAIRIYEKNAKNTKSAIYRIGSTLFEIPPSDFEIKITDYNKSNTADYITNKNATSSRENPYFDVHYFFQSLLFYFNIKGLPVELKHLIDDIIPEKIRSQTEEIEFNGLDETLFDAIASTILTPLMILKKNNFFSEFIKESIKDMDISASPYSNSSEDVTAIKTIARIH